MTAAVASTPLDLRQSGSYPIRLGASISSPQEAHRWENFQYNYKPRLSGEARISSSEDGQDGQLTLQDGNDEYKYQDRKVEDEDGYALICSGEGKDREWVLEKLSGIHHLNISSTPDNQDAAKLARRYPSIPHDGIAPDDAEMFGDYDDDRETDEADPNNPFDFRHFLKEEEAVKPQESSTGTPSLAPAKPLASTPITRPAKKVSAYAPTQKKRKAPAAQKAAPAKRAKAVEQTARAESPEEAPVEKKKNQETAKRPSAKSTRRDSPPQIRVDRKASMRKASFDDPEDSGELVLEDEDDAPSKPKTTSAMSLALHGHFGNGPVSLRSAASSPASRVASPAPEENLYAFELGGSESPEAAAAVVGNEDNDDDDGADADADADVEDFELPSPAQTQTQKSSSGQRKMSMAQQPISDSFDADDNEDDEDDLEKQLELAMAGDEEEEVSEEE